MEQQTDHLKLLILAIPDVDLGEMLFRGQAILHFWTPTEWRHRCYAGGWHRGVIAPGSYAKLMLKIAG